MKKQFLVLVTLLLSLNLVAQNWDYIQTSGEYYYGVGYGENEKEASERAMAELIGMIASHVSSEFNYIMLNEENNGKCSAA